MESELLNKRILVVTAHPDDESFLAAGTLAKNAQVGGRNFLVCATCGENGRAHLSRDYTLDELKSCRLAEIKSASGLLKIANPVICDYPDGKLVNFLQEFSQDIRGTIQTFEPHIVLGFGKDGFTGHHDHIAAFQAACVVAQEFNLPYFSFAAPPAPWREEYTKVLYGKRKNGQYLALDIDHTHDCVVVINPEIKLQALKCYASQFAGLDPHKLFTPALAEHFLTHEYFHFE